MKNKNIKILFITIIVITLIGIKVGKLIVYHYIPDNKITISKENAEEIAVNEIEKYLLETDNNFSIDSSTILKTEIKVINPNHYWEDTFTLKKTNPKKAYEVTFLKGIGDFIGEASIWIDAETGENLGGEQTK